MKLRIAFSRPKGTDDVPLVVACTDEYIIDDWSGHLPPFYNVEVQNAKDQDNDVREAFIYVPTRLVQELFEPPVLDVFEFGRIDNQPT